MPGFLAIYEVSGKQNYIFSNQKLRENASRSEHIAYVTSDAFFRSVLGTSSKLYSERNFVYSGGGHTVLEFDTLDQATAFNRAVTSAVIKQFPGMEMFVKCIPFDKETPRDNLTELAVQLERKKAQRSVSFRTLSLGVEKPDGTEPGRKEKVQVSHPLPDCPDPNYEYMVDFNNLPEDDGFLGVVHIDGNGMGAKVNAIYNRQSTDWDKCKKELRCFSEGIQTDFEETFDEMVRKLITFYETHSDKKDTLSTSQESGKYILPVRPVVLAGDDVCFVVNGAAALECARFFLECLSRKKIKPMNEECYAACAGVAIVHKKYPFHRAYMLSEELCLSAKKFCAALDVSGQGRVSAMDWHIEFGQVKDSLSEIREDYITDDENHMELRPVCVVKPSEVNATPDIRTYSFFRTMCGFIASEYKSKNRGKIKELRAALKQGELESAYYLKNNEISDMLYHPLDAMYNDAEKPDAQRRMLQGVDQFKKEVFRMCKTEEVGEKNKRKRCMFFDAIEMVDHCVFFEEDKQSE